MALFQTIFHPTDFGEPSKEAFRVARSLAQALGARVVVFHVLPSPWYLSPKGDGRVWHPKGASRDLWAEYRNLQTDTPKVPVEYAVVQEEGNKHEAKHTLKEKIRELGEDVLVVMGTHGRTGIRRLLWRNTVEKVIRNSLCSVLVVKSPVPTVETTARV